MFLKSSHFFYPWSVRNCKKLILKNSVYSRAFCNTIVLWLLNSIRHWERRIYWSITRKCKKGQLFHCAAHKSTPWVLPALAQVYQAGQVCGFFQKRSISVSREIQEAWSFLAKLCCCSLNLQFWESILLEWKNKQIPPVVAPSSMCTGIWHRKFWQAKRENVAP